MHEEHKYLWASLHLCHMGGEVTDTKDDEVDPPFSSCPQNHRTVVQLSQLDGLDQVLENRPGRLRNKE